MSLFQAMPPPLDGVCDLCALGTIFLIGSGHRRPHPLLPNGPRTQFGDCSYSSIPAHKKVSCFLELVAVAIVLPLSVVLPVEARRRPLLGDSEARCSAIAWCQQVPSYAALSFPDSSSVFLGHLCLWFSRSTIWLHLWCICGSISWRMSLLAFASPGRALSRRGFGLCRRFSGSRRATGRKQGGVGMMSGEVDEGWFALI